MRHDNLRTSQWLSLCTAIAVTGCIGGIDYDDEDTADPTQQNIQQYEQLRMSLEQKRELVLPADAVDDVQAAGPWLTWLDLSQGFSGVLHARRGAGGDEVVSEVPIGDDGTPPNYEIGEELAMTAVTVGGDAVYTVLRLGTGTALDQVTMTKPDAAKYDAYGVFAGQAYIVVEAEDLAIYEWTPGTDAPTQIASFGEAGTNFGAWLGFVVAEDMAGTRRLVGVGTLGTHSMDLATKQVTQVPASPARTSRSTGPQSTIAATRGSTPTTSPASRSRRSCSTTSITAARATALAGSSHTPGWPPATARWSCWGSRARTARPATTARPTASGCRRDARGFGVWWAP